MILVDNSQIIYSAIFSQRSFDITNENLVRHLVLNSYRHIKKKFSREYGELVLCEEGRGLDIPWRRQFFPLYKSARRTIKKENPDMWNRFYEIMGEIRSEVSEFFPYKSISVPGCEADDVIFVLTKTYHDSEPILIISGDKDFGQLQIYDGVKQYSPLQKKFIDISNAKSCLFEHIIRGDSSDGVPNIFSDDDCFIVEDKRQVPVTKKKLSEIESVWVNTGKVPESLAEKWNRNETLISHLCIPQQYQDRILEQWSNAPSQNRSKILGYMISKGMKNLMSDIGDF